MFRRVYISFFALFLIFPVVVAVQSSWDFTTNAEGWEAKKDISDLQVADGKLVITSIGEDPYLLSDSTLSLDASETEIFELRMRATGGTGGALFFLTGNDQNWNVAKSQYFSIPSDGQFHTYLIDLGANNQWKNTITQLRLDPTNAAGTVEIDYLRGLDVHYPHHILWLETSGYKVGVNLAWGGALSHLLLPDGFNIIDNHDPGRLIQASHYDNKNPHQWNPTQGGDVYQGSPVLDYSNSSTSIYIKTQPRNWIGGMLTNTFLEQWVDIVDNTTFKIRYRFIYQEPVTYSVPYLPRHELPALWLNKELFHALAYIGNKPWTFDTPMSYELPYLDAAIPFTPTEHWAGYEDTAGHRLLVYQPAAKLWVVKRFTTSPPDFTNPSYMSPVGEFALTPGLVQETTAYLFVGDLEDARTSIYTLAEELTCVHDTKAPCSTGLAGVCDQGERICVNNTWLACEQRVFASPDICNKQDDDCNGKIDDLDADGDAYGTCTTDCDDNNAAVHPFAVELCDNVDNNCNDLVDEGCTPEDCDDQDGDGVSTCDGDCDDTTALILPTKSELCDNVDNNCNDLVDEGCFFNPSVSPIHPAEESNELHSQSSQHFFFSNRFSFLTVGRLLLLLLFFILLLVLRKHKR